MLIVLRLDCNEQDTANVAAKLASWGVPAYPTRYNTRQLIGLGQTLTLELRTRLHENCPQIERILDIRTGYKLASSEFKATPSIVKVGEIEFGSGNFVVIAGPCTIESEEQLFKTAGAVKQAGANVLRGGAFKPRTSPYSFQGMGVEGLKLLQKVSRYYNIPTVTEVMESGYVDAVAEYADIMQIGARNMQNYPLLKAAGLAGKPILLKRGPSATLDEWLMAAEYILTTGNPNLILCERGIKSFDPTTRNCLDLGGVVAMQEKTHLPIIVDPSHATGKSSLVTPLSLAAAAIGASGVMVECHPQPDQALCDGAQSILPPELARLVKSVQNIVRATQEVYAPNVSEVAA